MVNLFLREPLVLLGASTRAAAYSAHRAGLRPYCADLFADQDLLDYCPVTQVSGRDYPTGLESAARQAPAGPWAYVGALENHPKLVARIAAVRALWGNRGEVLRRVRDPVLLAGCLNQMGLPHIEVRTCPDGLPEDGSWLSKPRRGAGGRGIHEWRGHAAHPASGNAAAQQFRSTAKLAVSTEQSRYFQRKVAGPAYSCIFVGNATCATLLGITRQLVGDQAFHASPFHYCGSIGPMQVPKSTRVVCERLGTALATEFKLVGLFGVDAILNHNVLWPVEVNPRFTASMEILEYALGVPLMELHRRACVSGELPSCSTSPKPAGSERRMQLLGKAILFAPNPMHAPPLDDWRRRQVEWPSPWRICQIADVPQEGSRIAPGSPILTIFATGQTPNECHRSLAALATEWYTQFSLVTGFRRI